MKNLTFDIFMLSILLFLHSCSKEHVDSTDKGTVQFAFSQDQLKSTEILTKSPSSILVTVEDLKGTVLFHNYPIVLYNMNGSFISNPLSLVPGNYLLKGFMVIDKNNNVLYVTPVVGSAKAYLVTVPLPISIKVIKNNVSKIVPEVLSTGVDKPRDFGYATFSFNIVKTFPFLLSVFEYNENTQNLKLTTANLTISGDSGWIYSKNKAACLDTIIVKDNQSKYILTLKKDGYNTWVDTLSADDLKLHFRSEDKGPLKVILIKNCNCPTSVTDFDGNIYHTVLIGTQCWLRENLKVTHLNDGTLIPNVTDHTAWMNLNHMGYCWYDNNLANKNIYGALYNAFSVHTAKLAPHGWHVATTLDMFTLTNYFGNTIGGEQLLETGNTHWLNSSIATNSTGFTALPAGFRMDDTQNGKFFGLGYETQWWCSDEFQTPSGSLKMNAWEIQSYESNFPQLALLFYPYEVNGCSVRCLKDE